MFNPGLYCVCYSQYEITVIFFFILLLFEIFICPEDNSYQYF